METVFYYFMKTLDGEQKKDPIFSTTYLGEIGDQVNINGIDYIIEDYTMEQYYPKYYMDDLSSDNF